MSVPLVMAATAAGMGAPAYAAGKEHQASAKAGARRVHPRILRLGDTGPDVVRLQRALGVSPDGIFGRQTLHAVLRFQHSHGLLADGEVGPHTQAAMRSAGRSADADIIIRLHDRGPAVAALQRALGITADGDFGPVTLHAVKHFQAAHGLLVDGQVGPHTRAALHLRASGDFVHEQPANGHRRHAPSHHRAGHGVMIVIRLHDVGPAVAALQRALGITADGEFGQITLHAVKQFQRRHGLLVDGQVGPNTRAALHLPASSDFHHRTGGWSTGGGTHHRHHQGGGTSGSLGQRAVALAMRELGTPYVWGGESPSGFDCSGLVWYVYGKLGVSLPRVAAAQYGAGRHVARSALRAGDLVFFDHLGHVGIYIGGGRFIHAPHTGTVVQISSLTGWYSETYVGATRVS